MRFLFLLAHPDDEAIGSGGTIKRLTEAGNEVILVVATDGAAGEGGDPETLGQVRRKELKCSCDILGVKQVRVLDFEDGEITNKLVWGELTQVFTALIDEHNPDFVVTFDHSGWYFHLDHIGVSIAATVAAQQVIRPPLGLLLNLHLPATAGTRWKYVFTDKLPATHAVDVSQVKEVKLAALKAHASQHSPTFLSHLENNPRPEELFQLVFEHDNGREKLEKTGIFEQVAR